MANASAHITSPVKASASPVTREARTLHLRNEHFVVLLDVPAFEKAFLKTPSFGKRVLASCSQVTKYDDLVNQIQNKPEGGGYEPTHDLLNAFSDRYCEVQKIPEKDQVAFIVHERHPPLHHPHSFTNKCAKQKPDIFALQKLLAKLWEKDIARWKLAGGPKPAVAWHNVGSALEGKGPSYPDPVYQAATYAGSLLQARPDLPGNFSLAYSSSYFRILWSDSAGVYSTDQIKWTNADAPRLLALYVHFLHKPLLVDPTFTLHAPDTQFDKGPLEGWDKKSYASPPTWMVEDDIGNVYEVTEVISVGEPCTRRNWVGRATRCGRRGEELRDCPAVIIKDSYPDTRRLSKSSEGAILDQIHVKGRRVLGVMVKRYAFKVLYRNKPVRNIHLGLRRNKCEIPRRARYRLFLEDAADNSVMASPTVLNFLMVMFDVLVVHEFILEHRDVLHRDISPWNLIRLILEDDSKLHDPSTTLSEDQPVFIRALLAFADANPLEQNKPSCLIIDFDNAQVGKKHTGAHRTGTPTFVARAICKGQSTTMTPKPFPIPQLSGKAKDSYVRLLGQERYDTRSTLHSGKSVPEEAVGELKVEHAARHDAESCFWIIVYFLILGLPRDADPKQDDTTSMSTAFHFLDSHRINNDGDSRDCIMKYGMSNWERMLHPGLRSLAPLLADLTILLTPEYALVQPDLDPYNVHEAMLRLLLREIWRLKDSDDPLSLHVQKRTPQPIVMDGHSSTQASAHASAHASAKRTADALDLKGSKKSKKARLAVASAPAAVQVASTSGAPSTSAAPMALGALRTRGKRAGG